MAVLDEVAQCLELSWLTLWRGGLESKGQQSSISEQELVRCSGPLFSGLFSGLFQAQMKAAAAGKGGPVAEMHWDDPVEVHIISSCCFSCVIQ